MSCCGKELGSFYHLLDSSKLLTELSLKSSIFLIQSFFEQLLFIV